MRLRSVIFYLILCILPICQLEAAALPRTEVRGQLLRPLTSEKDPIILYPHLALGAGFQVVLLASNSLTSAFNGTVRLPSFGEGSEIPWFVNDQDMTGLDRFQISIPPRSTARFLLETLPGSGPFVGPVEIHGNSQDPEAGLATTFFYEYFQGGRLVDSIGIPRAQPGTRILLPVELSSESKVNTGVAIQIRSDDSEDTGSPDSIDVFLFDAQGDLVGQASGPFLGAKFFTEMIPGIVPESGGEFLGSMRIEYADELFVVALRQQLFEDGSFQLTGVPPLVLPDEEPSYAAQYELTFDASWSSNTHPTDFPPGPHFSGLIGGTHKTEGDFWQSGQFASAGIKNMAETGSKDPLRSEVAAAMTQGQAEKVISGGGIGNSPGGVALSFDVTVAFPLVTAVSMIAPSPDWFVGVDGLSLLLDGKWVEELVVELFPYDAGTDSGPTYTSPNQPTVPPQAISRLEGSPFLKSGLVQPLGTFTFRRVR